MEKTVETVEALMHQRRLSVDDLETRSGLERRVIEAIVHQRYTPSPEQRQRVAEALGVERTHIVWGHINVPQPYIHAPI